MQIIEKILMIDGPSAQIVDSWGKSADGLEIMVGVRTRLAFDLRTTEANVETGELLAVNPDEYSADSYYIAMDADYNQETIPKLLKADGITLDTGTPERVKLLVDIPDTSVPKLLEALENAGSISFHCEIGGFEVTDSEAAAGFVFQFEATVRNRVWIGGEVPPEVVENPGYLTEAEVRALIEEATRPERGPQGEPGLSAYEVAKKGGYKGTEAEWLESLKGADGKDGVPGKSAYEIAKDGGYEGTEQEWLQSLKGAAGLSAYQIACLYGFKGTEEAWLASLKGAPGDGLFFDATGDVSELDLYDDEEEGFVFAGTENDPEKHSSTLYLWKKKSNDSGDWYEPLTLTFYEKEYKLEAMPPITFKKPQEGEAAEYLTFSLADYPYATVASVCIDQEEGELTLPYGSARGVRKIVKSKDKRVFIYFGTHVPEYETGKIYLTQFHDVVSETSSGGLPGVDGEDSGSGQGKYEGKMFYGYIPSSALNEVHKISEITMEMLTGSSGHVKQVDAGTLDLTSLGEVPAGAMVIVAIPVKNPLRAEKFNGLGGYTTFIEGNVEARTGANGTPLTLDKNQYKVWGEYVLATAEISIRITAQEKKKK